MAHISIFILVRARGYSSVKTIEFYLVFHILLNGVPLIDPA